MSYILDALRRAESERQRGQVPGLGATPLPAAHAAGPAGQRALLWAALILVMLGLAAALLWWSRGPATAPERAQVESAPTSTPASLTPVAAAPLPTAAVPPALPVVVSAPPAAAPAPVAAPSTAEPAAARHVFKLAELTQQQRSEWPPLAVGGSVWSDSAVSRFVILNGQVLREGQALQPGLVLERIQPKSALLRWRGLLVELPL